MDDRGFVRRCISGQKQAWDEFLQRYSRLIYNYIHSVLRLKGYPCQQTLVEELFQEIILLLLDRNFHKLKSYRGLNGCSLASWLRQVVINYSLSALRDRRVMVSLDQEPPLVEPGLLVAPGKPASAEAIDQERVLALRECIDRLESEEKYFLTLHFHANMSLDALKDHLRVSRAALDMRKSRLLSRLKECFKGKGILLDI
ncbi:MAG TPA: sigma-70 family RNA polymerase sigma factor [Candidatus Omnitrophota bacterium]|nr:sigma-70 family RNA polymerase sigma factor [Candidatus Omnitrophota bacterium]HRZ14172.1 sigma-70 family RNA polymerase sigma factor [Candidatus Omnitrophota bacterium]